MLGVKKNYIPFGTDASTCYSNSVKRHHLIATELRPVVLAAIDKIVPNGDEAVTIGDYGCADGGVLYQILEDCIDLLRRKFGAGQHIQVVYEDQPINDFKPVFMGSQDSVTEVDGLANKFPNVFVLASGCSFDSQCLPRNSIDLIFCSQDTQWLSECPTAECDSLYPVETPGPLTELFRAQGIEYWDNFLIFRERELRKGGYLIVTRPTTAEVGQILRRTLVCDNAWLSLEDGMITEEEYKRTCIGEYFLSKDDLMKPFVTSPVKDSGLVVEIFETLTLKCPFRDYLEKMGIDAQDETYKLRLVDLMVAEKRAWEEGALHNGLSDHRSNEEKKQILDVFYFRYRNRLLERPLSFQDFTIDYMVIKKQ